MRAEYTSSTPVGVERFFRIDADPSTLSIAKAWNGLVPPTFQAEWSGFLVVDRSGWYTFGTTSDDGSMLAVDGRWVVDNSGDHSPRLRTGRIWLRRGTHPVLIDYAQSGGGYAMEWDWSGSGGPLRPVPAWAVWTRPTGLVRALAARLIDPVLYGTLFGAALIAIEIGIGRARRARRIAEATRQGESVDSVALWVPVYRGILLLASVAVALLVAEGFARLWFHNVRSSGDARTYFAARATPVRTNRLGFRDADPSKKSAGRYRIVVVGDSFTWGVGLPENERFTNVMQASLGPGYEVLNFGIPGNNLPEHLQVLEEALATKPDFILLQLYTNDFELHGMQRPAPKRLLPWPVVDRWLLRHSALYTLLNVRWPQLQQWLGVTETYEHYMYRFLGDPDSPQTRLGLSMLRAFVERAREAGVPTGVVMFPNPGYLTHTSYTFDYLHERVLAVCADEHIGCVDLRAPFRSHFQNLHDIMVSDFDGHPSARADGVAANEILKEFQHQWRQGPAGVAGRRVLPAAGAGIGPISSNPAGAPPQAQSRPTPADRVLP